MKAGRFRNSAAIQTLLVFSHFVGLGCAAQIQPVLPATSAETLSGKPIVLPDAIRGHEAVLVAGFSRQAGDECATWVRTLHADPAMAGVEIYSVAMLEQAPAILRGIIKSGMRKGMTQESQDHSIIFTRDEKLWRIYFTVTDDNWAYVVFLNPRGQILWRGHGPPIDQEPQLRIARH